MVVRANVTVMSHFTHMFLAIFCVLLSTTPTTATTVLLLKDGGTLEGELLNPDEINRKLYRVKTAEGFEICLNSQLVEKVQGREREALIEYNRDAPLTSNTIENHLLWAKWCNEHQLPAQAKVHWQQILELDPDHADARRALGYNKTAAGWESQQEKLEHRGYIFERGQWKTSYEIEVAKMLENRKQESDNWQRTIRELYRRLPQTENELLAIRNPAAVIPIRDVLVEENNPYVRTILLRTLVQIPDNYAIQLVAGWPIRPDEPLEDIRKMCIEELQRRISTQPEIRGIMIGVYRDALRSKTVDPIIINLAAKVLADIGGHEAIPELIDVLVVQRKETIQNQPQNYGFGGSKSGFSQAGKPITVPIVEPNPIVRSALIKLTGCDFEFNQTMWRDWYRRTLRSPTLNLRTS